MKHLIFIAAVLFFACQTSVADEIKFVGGGKADWKIVQEGPDSILVIVDEGLIKVSRSMIASVKRDKKADPAKQAQPKEGEKPALVQLPAWTDLVISVAAEKWATNLKQIPATVVDNGVLRNVPYKSHRCGSDYEFNVYGDPGDPAGFEIGIYRDLLTDQKAKSNCIEWVASLVGDKTNAAIVRALKLDEDMVERGEWTFEITPPSAEDAYGGWWISVYSETKLESVRASEKEMEEITETPGQAKPTPNSAPKPDSAVQPAAAEKEVIPHVESRWDADDFKLARQIKATPARSTPRSPSAEPIRSSGAVYVRGYTRKDGTYVRPHTRRR